MMTLLLVPPLAAAVLVLAAGCYRSCAMGAGVAVLAYVAVAVAASPLGFLAGGFHIYVEDLCGSFLVAVGAARWATRPSVGSRWRGWLPFAGATATAFAVGAAWHGLKAAGVEYRSFFCLCAAALYCASFPLSSREMKRLIDIWLGGAVLLMALAWFRWSSGFLHWEGAGSNPWRVLNASQSLYLAQAFLMLLYLRRHARATGTLTAFALLLVVTVLLLQHRSVWVATAMAWALMVWHERQVRHVLRAAAIFAFLLLLVYWRMPGLLWRARPAVEAIAASIQEPLRYGNSTLAWRVGLWSEYLLEYAGLPRWQMLVGTGLGNSGNYRLGLVAVEESAHNYFVFVLNRAGLVGLVALLAGYGTLLRGLRGSGGHWDYLGLLLVVTFSQLVYFLVYSPSSDQGLWIGAGLSVGRIAHGVHRHPGA